ncbi:protein OSCP1-like [Uloborus diversus]|uniref:protein OSCP1-like n=1 Tax=Uloborus diversus TaxID=327109 RepID=UPI002409641E|nr:protein OSCP1-like [Uloborus diversus]
MNIYLYVNVKMTEKVLPIVFINLSGEMIYVIQQRLEAQNISSDKSVKVIQDIIGTMLNDQFIEELFKPQKMYSRSAMQCVFEKLVHSSIMRLNSNSMSKLYDLMLMVFKYQVANCLCPEDILLVTLNHLDAIKNCAKPYPDLMKKVELLHSLVYSTYCGMTSENYADLYNCIVAFLGDLNIRVSVLMKLGLQKMNGEIVKKAAECIEKLDAFRKCLKALSSHENDAKNNAFVNCLMFDGDRIIDLGSNIYMKSALLDASENKSPVDYSLPLSKEDENTEKTNVEALEELSLLGRLIGKYSQSLNAPEIILATTDEENVNDVHDTSVTDNCSYVNINAPRVCQAELGKISNDLLVKEDTKATTDILEFLDIAENSGS